MTKLRKAPHPTRRHARTPRGLAAGLGALLLVLFLAACGETTTDPTPAVNSVAIEGGDFALLEGTSTTLTATVDVTGGASQDVTWSTSDAAVADIDAATGEITATGTAGDTAQITATSVADATVADTVTVTITSSAPGVLSVTIDGGDFQLQEATTTTLTATVDVTGGASQDVTWSTSDAAVADIDAATGEITATGTAGDTAQITATSVADATVADTVTVTITDTPVTSISDLTATIVLGSQVELAWTATNVDTFDVVCYDGGGGGETTLDSVTGTASGTTVAIPATDCQTVRVLARGTESDDSVETALTGVVLNGNDDGLGSLRAVYADASTGDVIGFASDVTEVVLSGKDFLGPNDAHMILDADVTISGPTATPVTVRSDDSVDNNDTAGIPVLRTRVFYVPSVATVQLDGLVISGGTFIASGGGVRNDGTLTISNSTVEGNRAYYRGGGVVNLGTLTIESSIIRGNRAEVNDAESAAVFACIDDTTRSCVVGDPEYLEFGQGGSGGGVYSETGSITIVDTTIDGNTAVFSGGGIYVAGGTVDATTTTVNNNLASDASVTAFTTYSFGGGIANFVDGGYVMTGGSVERNVSADVGGGLANGSSTVVDLGMTLADVTVTGNDAGTFGGGYIHYYQAVAPGSDGTYSITESGSTSVAGNTSGTADPNRSFNEVVLATSSQTPTELTTPYSPGAADQR